MKMCLMFLVLLTGEIEHSAAVHLRDGTSLSGKTIGLIPLGKDIDCPIKGWRRLTYTDKDIGTLKFKTKSLGIINVPLSEINWLDTMWKADGK